MNSSCRDSVSASNMKKIDEELMIFDRFVDTDSHCGIIWKETVKFKTIFYFDEKSVGY